MQILGNHQCQQLELGRVMGLMKIPGGRHFQHSPRLTAAHRHEQHVFYLLGSRVSNIKLSR